jgi:putative tryptophan/tyrosine transport system substrate-binding protein
VKRRDFITLLGGATVARPITAHAQQAERMRRIGVLMDLAENDPEGQVRIAAFLQGLQQLGWTDGRNVRIDTRWTAGDADRTRRQAAELIALAPDVVVATGTPTLGPLQQATRTVPIVFMMTVDPVGGGFVDSLARPGGNTTGFMLFEYGMGGKWLELLKEIAPRVTRVGTEVSPINLRDSPEIERGVTAFARSANGGLIVTTNTLANVHRDLIVMLAARHKLPALYSARYFVIGGGLMSYGPDRIDQSRRAAAYVDRILKGEKPADLPVQAPTKYELVINLKTAKALGLTVPDTLLARADEVIE